MRLCGILKVALREDDPGHKLRLAAEDVAGATVQGKPIEPGLYFCSKDAIDQLGPRVLERLKRDGIAPADATLATLDPRLLT